MPTPTSALSVQRNDLAAAFEEFDLEMNQAQFVATRVLPVVNVAMQAGQFPIIPIEQLLQNRDTERSPGSGYARGSFRFAKGNYATQENGAEEPIDDRERKMYADLLSADYYAAKRAYSAVLVNAERRAAAMLFNATTWTGANLTTGITNEWDDPENAVPVTDVEGAVRKVYDGSGLWPNALIINRKVFRNLRLCEQIVEMVKFQGFMDARPGNITVDQLAAVFDLEHIIVGGGTKNNAAEGLAASPAQIWSDEYAMVARIATSGDFREPCVGRTFHWAEDGSTIDGKFEQYRDETIRGDVIRVRHDTDEMVLYKEAAHLLSNVTT